MARQGTGTASPMLPVLRTRNVHHVYGNLKIAILQTKIVSKSKAFL